MECALHTPNKFMRTHSESSGNSLNSLQRGQSFPSLDEAYERAMDAAFLGKVFLAQARILAQAVECLPKGCGPLLSR